jgi:hypothetical protein
MISSLRINGYRGFERLDMTGLGQLNLLVGKNNSGKTSVLEAMHLLTSRGDPAALWQVLWRRGERFPVEQDPRRPQPEVDISHLFTGHEIRPGANFTFATTNEAPESSITFEIAELGPKEQVDLFGPDEEVAVPSKRFALEIKGTPQPVIQMIPLSRSGGLGGETLNLSHGVGLCRRANEAAPTQYIATESLTGDQLVYLWNRVQLTPHEELVLRALRFLDPDVERVAAQHTAQAYYGASSGRGGFIIKRKGSDYPIPLGSLGDGMWRMLTMAIAITQAKGGVLLVDEIDTGLHYTAMAEMWRLIFGAAQEFHVQVFATTHSYDCVHSLSTICAADAEARRHVTIQRIEAGKHKAIPYDEREIKLAAERHIEVR